MIIEKHGDADKIDVIRGIIKYECDRCGCVFKADITEYKIYPVESTGWDRSYTACVCPDCGKTVRRYP